MLPEGLQKTNYGLRLCFLLRATIIIKTAHHVCHWSCRYFFCCSVHFIFLCCALIWGLMNFYLPDLSLGYKKTPAVSRGQLNLF